MEQGKGEKEKVKRRAGAMTTKEIRQAALFLVVTLLVVLCAAGFILAGVSAALTVAHKIGALLSSVEKAIGGQLL